jgi:CRISPR-associated protein Csd1
MILQALNDYYDRNEELPRQGWIRRGVDYAIVLDSTGSCIAIDSLGTASKGKTTALEMLFARFAYFKVLTVSSKL